jgi:creatinine amidohydrolase
MRWEEMTWADLKEARRHQVAIFCLGSLEKHGDHLPVGIDTIFAHHYACAAAEREPAVVLPPLFYALAIEPKTRPGAISISAPNLLAFCEEICDEIFRNGFRKIIFFNVHGGNLAFVRVFGQHILDKQKPYLLYFPRIWPEEALRREVLETECHGHACECETSEALYVAPELVKMERVSPQPVLPRKEYDLPGGETSLRVTSTWPELVMGEPAKATAEKGRRLVERRIQDLADFIRKVKEVDKIFDHLDEYIRDTNEAVPPPAR